MRSRSNKRTSEITFSVNVGPESPARRSGRERKPSAKLVQLQNTSKHKADTIIKAVEERVDEDEILGKILDKRKKSQQGQRHLNFCVCFWAVDV